MPKEKLTPEQEHAEKVLKEAGYVDETEIANNDSNPMAEEPEPEKAPDPEPESSEDKPLSAEELKELREQAKRGGWAEREKERADRERADRERYQQENERLRQALGQPVKPPAVEPTDQEKVARKWLKDNLAEILPEVLAGIPEDVMEKHPAFRKRDAAILLTHDTVDQQAFLSQFDGEKKALIKKKVLPELRQRRIQSNWQKDYDTLWGEKQAEMQETTTLYGAPPADPHSPGQPLPRPSTPPHLAGVHGGQPKPRSDTAPPLTADEMRVMGLQ